MMLTRYIRFSPLVRNTKSTCMVVLDVAWAFAADPSNILIGLNGMNIHCVWTINQSIRMCWKGLSETPSNKEESLEGFCVGLFVRYRCILHIASPCELTLWKRVLWTPLSLRKFVPAFKTVVMIKLKHTSWNACFPTNQDPSIVALPHSRSLHEPSFVAHTPPELHGTLQSKTILFP